MRMNYETHNPELLVVHDLTLRVEEAQSALCAIRAGEADALVIANGDQPQVYILKGADQAHRILFETLNEGAMTIAADTTILYANRRLAELLGQPLEKVLGVSLVRFIAPADVRVFQMLLQRTGDTGSRGEIALVTAHGTRVPVTASMSAMASDAGTVYTVVVNDLTDLKEAQQALQKTNDELEARVEHRTQELAKANEALHAEIAERTRLEQELRQRAEELVEADRRKDEFLSMLSHELRNPLAPLLNIAELLRRVAHDPVAIKRYQELIDRQVRNLARLVDDLLDVSRITRRVITLRPVVVALSSVVRSALEASRPCIDSRKHELRISLPAECVRIRVDPTRFEQVLINLLNNAAKYTEPGGIISLSAELQGDQMVIRVRDTGVGIPAELLPRIFDLFVQGERSLDRSQGGLGIGLTLVKTLVEMHGGHIEALSDGAGRGSEFVLYMPAAPDTEGENRGLSARPDDRHEAAAQHGIVERMPVNLAQMRRRVLLVEDNADAMMSMKDLLELWGHEVRAARNGNEALRLASEFRPEIVLIDIGLPGMDGYEVARRLRILHSGPPGSVHAGELPVVIAITGYGRESDRSQGLEAGFDHYLVKPPDPSILQRLLQHGQAAFPVDH